MLGSWIGTTPVRMVSNYDDQARGLPSRVHNLRGFASWGWRYPVMVGRVLITVSSWTLIGPPSRLCMSNSIILGCVLC